MGFGSIIATAMLAIAMLALVITIIHVGTLSVVKTEEALHKQTQLLNNKLKTKITIDNIIIDSLDPSLVYVNVTNTGSTSINIGTFNNVDVVVTYISTTGVKVVKRLTYNASGVGEDIWYIKRVLVNNREGDIVNPINLTLQQGLWDPGETLELTLKLSTSVNSSQGLSIVMALPNGEKTMYSV